MTDFDKRVYEKCKGRRLKRSQPTDSVCTGISIPLDPEGKASGRYSGDPREKYNGKIKDLF